MWTPEERDNLLGYLDNISSYMGRAADALTRQAVVMERDVEDEAPPKDINEAINNTFMRVTGEYVNYIKRLGDRLDNIVTRTYLNDMERARAVREFQQDLENFEGIEIELG